MQQMSKIIDGLYLGGEYDAFDYNNFVKYNIKAVINVTPDVPNFFEDKGITYLRVPILDNINENISTFFPQTFEFIETHIQNGGVLVHCRMGVSRSATIVVAFLMKKKNLEFREALEFVRTNRARIDPNLGFEIQLLNYMY